MSGKRQSLSNDRHTSVIEYLSTGIEQVEGWLWPTTASVIADLVSYQTGLGVSGNMCEIGVHHGKLFLILANSTVADEIVYAVDVFEDQTKNIDQSGAGDRVRFETNLKSFGHGLSNVKIIQASSLDLATAGFCENSFRFISVDGGHTCAITENDLRLAESTLLNEGVVALDDILNCEWTGVLSGFASYILEGKLLPFAIVPNKLLLTTDRFSATKYKEKLSSTFPFALRKSGQEFFGYSIDVYSEHEIYNTAALHHAQTEPAISGDQSRRQVGVDPERLEILQSERDALASQLSAMKSELDSMASSTSWRLSAPLRAAGRLLLNRP